MVLDLGAERPQRASDGALGLVHAPGRVPGHRLPAGPVVRVPAPHDLLDPVPKLDRGAARFEVALVGRGRPVELPRAEAIKRLRVALEVAERLEQGGEERLRRVGPAIAEPRDPLVGGERRDEVQHGRARARRQPGRLGERGNVVDCRPVERLEDGERPAPLPARAVGQEPQAVGEAPAPVPRPPRLDADPRPRRRSHRGRREGVRRVPAERRHRRLVAVELEDPEPASWTRSEADRPSVRGPALSGRSGHGRMIQSSASAPAGAGDTPP